MFSRVFFQGINCQLCSAISTGCEVCDSSGCKACGTGYFLNTGTALCVACVTKYLAGWVVIHD